MGYNPIVLFCVAVITALGFSGGEALKNPLACAGGMGSLPGLGRSPGGRHGNPLQYSGLENPMGRGAWRATVHGVAKSQTGLNDLAHRETLVSHMHGG